MPPLSSKDAIRAILRRDPVWYVCAGDLSPDMFPKTAWFTPDLCAAGLFARLPHGPRVKRWLFHRQ